MKKYYLFGDSIMRGVMPDENGSYHSSDLLGFDSCNEKYNIDFKNFAMPTFTTDRILMWIKSTMAGNEMPDVVFLEGGGNDCDYNWKEIADGSLPYEKRHRVSLSDFSRNFSWMISFFRDKGVRVICVLCPPIPVEKYLDNIFKSGIDRESVKKYLSSPDDVRKEYGEYKAETIRLAKENNCEILDLSHNFENIENLSEYYSMDGMHPNEKGYELMRISFSHFFEGDMEC